MKKYLSAFLILILCLTLFFSLFLTASAFEYSYLNFDSDSPFGYIRNGNIHFDFESSIGNFDIPITSDYSTDITIDYYNNGFGGYIESYFNINYLDYIPIFFASNYDYDSTDFGYWVINDVPNNYDDYGFNVNSVDYVAISVLNDDIIKDYQNDGVNFYMSGFGEADYGFKWSLVLIPVNSSFVKLSPYATLLSPDISDEEVPSDSLYGLAYYSIGGFMFDNLDDLTEVQLLVLNILSAVVWIALLAVPFIVVFFLFRLIL